MKKIIYIFILFYNYLAAQTTITRQGQNYWGGAYVAPTWTKTYKDYSSPSSNSNANYSSSNYKSNYATSSSSGTGSTYGGKVYLSLARYNYDKDASRAHAEEKLRLERIQAEKANKQAKLFFEKLDEAKDLILNQKLYINGFLALTRDMQDISNDAKSEYAGFDASDEYYDLIKDYYEEVRYYIFLSQVKIDMYESAAIFYKFNFTKKNVDSSQKKEDVLPITPQNYYFMNEENSTIPEEFYKSGKLKFSPEERLKVDLFFVQTLLGLNKTEEAKNALIHIIKFYEPIVPDFSYIADELTLIYFNLGELDLAQKNLEYYCEFKKSNYYRYRLISDILEDERWNGEKNAEAIKFLERNLIFLEDLERNSNPSQTDIFYDRNWHILYTQKSNNLKAYVERKKEYIKIAEKDPNFSAYGDNYLATLIKIKDEAEINRVLLKLKTLGENRAKMNLEFQQQKLDNLLTEYNGFIVKKDYEKTLYNNCWNNYYRILARPTIDALFYFENTMLKNFYEAGGCKYIKPLLAEYSEFLNQFTSDEIGSHADLVQCIQLKLKKSRTYPKVFNPLAVKLTWPNKL